MRGMWRLRDFTGDDIDWVLGELMRPGRKFWVIPVHGRLVAFLVRRKMAHKLKRKYDLFARYGRTCVGCGVIGNVLAFERQNSGSQSLHFNLYARDRQGRDTLMTVDHILPRARGGSKNADLNLQVMCANCNEKKGVMAPWEEGLGLSQYELSGLPLHAFLPSVLPPFGAFQTAI